MPHKVLLIDDSPAMFPLVRARLLSEPVEVVYARDGLTGLDMARALRPDLILLDVDMPQPDGFETCRLLKREPHLLHTPVVFLTGTASSAEKMLGLDLGAVDYVTKPFDSVELVARVRSALRLRQFAELLATKARVDPVTGLWNLDYFRSRLSAELSLASRTHRSVSVILLAADHFKRVNSQYGPWFGDDVLRTLAATVSRSTRTQDIVCRLPGPELGIICPACPADGANSLAHRLQTAVAATRFTTPDHTLHFTASFGIASTPPAPDLLPSPEALEAAARTALEQSVSDGRNRITSAPERFSPDQTRPAVAPQLLRRRSTDPSPPPSPPEAPPAVPPEAPAAAA